MVGLNFVTSLGPIDSIHFKRVNVFSDSSFGGSMTRKNPAVVDRFQGPFPRTLKNPK
jgi:hypothetical protein